MECQRRGIAVPDDLAIAGFGDFEIGAQILPSLTTVHIDCVGIGERTGQLLLDLLSHSSEKEANEHQVIDLGFKLIERESTGMTSTAN
jgi:LacI family gluconate utilization system Gnt-I transcriptional repressor